MRQVLPQARGMLLAAFASFFVALLAAGCGGAGSTSPDGASASTTPLAAQAKPIGGGGATSTAFNGGVTDPGLLLLLLPDNLPLTDGRIVAWTDAAVELGVRMAPISDAQFLAMGPATALQYAGLMLPDDMHALATDTVIAAVRSYVNLGGRAMLTFDFGALTTTDTGVPVYAVPKSRLSDLAGVDYVLYDELRDRTTGLGPVTAMRSAFRQLQVPPGKSLPYTASASPQAATLDATAIAAVDAARAASALTRYLPVSVDDPGGVRGFDPQQFQQVRQPTVRERREGRMRARVAIDYGRSRIAPPVTGVTRAPPQTARALDAALASAATGLAPQATLAADGLDALSGYLIGYLTYPSYVTRGTFAGLALAASPQFGLVAGVNTFGAGKVLFVNMPLTYLKGRTDGMPLHGFLSYFVHQMGQAPYVSPMPNGIAGLTLNWHLDSNAAQTPTLALEQQGIFNGSRKFSMHMTAGPDTITPGDGLGWNLSNNPVAQDLLRRLDAAGQDVGSHGGWIHDYYGGNANEGNQAEFLPYLQLNQQAVDGLLGKPARSYSAPEGNNPKWAMDWLEQQGVEGAYFLGHTGMGPTRHFRDGQLLNPKLYVFPVTPNGIYATFEEWQFFNVPKEEVTAWYHELVDFAVQNDTNRLVYMHPPGASAWVDVVQDLLAYADAKGASSYRWYSMATLANALQKRLKVSWKQAVLADGSTRFDATHPNNLGTIVWKLPKARYLKPVVALGSATVADGGTFWLVKPTAGKTLQFTARRAG
ncbi:MAG: hypothetical protein V4864_07625 [Pseudomonadota bacterium]